MRGLRAERFRTSADLILLNDPAGHEGFTRQIVAAAMARHAGRHNVSELWRDTI
jgi:hypothetical protein